MSKSWMLTQTRRKVFPLDFKDNDVSLEDIARSLSKQCRYNGHVDRFFTVAEHSVLISRALERDGYGRVLAKLGLLHDSAECYTGDIIKPFKNALEDKGFSIKPYELHIEEAISRQFNLPWPWPEVIHEYDRRIVRDEKDQLKYDPSDDWASFNIPEVGLDVECVGWMPDQAYEEFMRRYTEVI